MTIQKVRLSLKKAMCGNTVSSKPSQSLLIGLTVTIAQPQMTYSEVVEYIQNEYFDNDDIAPSGFFRLMPMSRSPEFANLDYLNCLGEFNTPDVDFSACITHKDNQTMAEILFGQLSFESTYMDELECTQKELQSALNEGVFTAVVQNDLCVVRPI